jgi:galactokinase
VNYESDIVNSLRASFAVQFGREPSLIASAPGRVNLIGEHTDYNDGFVMPLAIDHAAWIAGRARADRQVVLWSDNFQNRQVFTLDHIDHVEGDGGWSNYTRGVASILEQSGQSLSGMDAVVWGDVPIGSGLSSSAALEVASALALSALAGSGSVFTGIQLARLTQHAEIDFVGVNCGIMDQMISVLGQAGNALLIDCRSLTYEPVPIPSACAIVVADTMKRRGLVDSKYNERRSECEVGARLLGVSSLRDIAASQFEYRKLILPDVIRRRCRHVVTENVRVLECAHALRQGRLEQAGSLLLQSHASLRDDYEVSCPELDLMVELALGLVGIYGARMTGAGFGGCTVNLVQRSAAHNFAACLAAAYSERTSIAPSIYMCEASQGAQLIPITA